jgi:hypothetical protein
MSRFLSGVCQGKICLTLMLGLAIGCGSGPAAAPTAFVEYNSKAGTFACEYPEGWQADGGGGRGPEWAKFTSGGAEINLATGLAASLVGDAAGGGTGFDDEPIPPELEPIHQIHVMGVEEAEGKFNGYKETGQPTVLEVSLGPARVSEFTAATTFGTGLHGYRATVLGHDKGVYVTCVCPESDWKTLQPAFDKLLASLHRGQAE